MAKQTKVDLDNIDLDRELDFDNFLIDDIDDSLSPEAKNKKNRSPIIDVFKGTMSGIKSKFTDPSFLARTVRKALPKEYEVAFSAVDEVAGAASSLYDEAVREVKPQVSKLATRIDRLVPEEKRATKKVTAKLKQIFGDELDNYTGPSKEQLQEQSVTNSLAAVFAAQNKIDQDQKARESAQDRINERIETRRFHSGLVELKSINEGVTRLASYNDSINQAYQKKSLELQFRTYFNQSEQLRTMNRFFEIFKNQNDAIAKNTGLPEFVKIQNSEKFREIAKGKFFDAVQSSFFGNNDFIKNAVTKFKDQTRQTIRGFKSGLEGAVQGLDAIEQMREQNRIMEESGIPGMSKSEMFGMTAGDYIATMLRDIVAKKAREHLPEDSPLARAGYKAADWATNLQGQIKEGKNSTFIRDNAFDTGAKGKVAKGLSWFLDLFDTSDSASVVPGSGGIRGLDQPGIYNNKTNKTITDVIPGYLARIYRELIALRTNDPDVDLTVYDYASGRFMGKKNAASDIKKSLVDKIKNSSYGYYVNEAMKDLVGETELSQNQELEIKDFLSKLSSTTMTYTPDNIKNSNAYRNLDVSTADIINRSLDRKINLANDNEKGQFELTKNITRIRDSSPNIKGEIELYIRAGYGDILEELGVVTRNKDGSFTINNDKYQEMVKDNGLVSSDVNVKQNIKAYKPNDALRAINNTRIYNWRYKQGKGDSRRHTGPMAQDVERNLGQQAAPGGTKIDLTTMNGVNMSAIQALSKQINNMMRSDSNVTALQGIKSDTSKIVEILSKGHVGASGSDNGIVININGKDIETKSFLSRVFAAGSNAVASLFDVTVKSSVFTKDKLIKPVVGLIKDGFKVDEDGKAGIFRRLFDKAGEMSIKLMDTGIDIITNKLPAGFKELRALGTKTIDKLNELLQGPIDIYVRGRKSPAIRAALMKAGYYIDQATGTVIKSISDIKGPVVNRFNEVVLTEEDVSAGLVDIRGKKIDTPFAKLAKFAFVSAVKGIKKLGGITGDLFGTSFDLASGFTGKIKSFFSNIDLSFGNDKIYNVLVEIRDLIKIKGNAGNDDPIEIEDIAKYGKKPTSVLTLLQSVLNKKSANDETNKQTSKSGIKKLIALSQPLTTKQILWNDRDASGARDGAWQERYEELKKRDKERKTATAKADLTLRYKGENIFDNLLGKFKSLSDILTTGASGMFSKLSGLFGAAGGLLGAGGKAGIIKSLGSKLLGVLKSPKTLATGAVKLAGTVGKPIASIAGAAGAGKLATMAAAAKSLLTTGALATGATGSVISAASAGTMAAVSAIIGSPVLIGAAAAAGVALAGYGIYKTYKYFTRDKLNEYDAIRIKQYGLMNAGGDLHHNHEIIELENYLLDGKVGYNRGQAYLVRDGIDAEEVLNIFSIDKGDEKYIPRFTEWFQERFKPFFLTHLTALYAVNNKAKLEDIEDLKPEERIRYLGMISYDSGPYAITVSPFKDIEVLSVNKELIINDIAELTASIKSEFKKDTPKKPTRNLFKELAAKSAKPKEKLDLLDPKNTNKYKTKQDKPSVGEDGSNKETDKTKAAKIINAAAKTAVAPANDEIRDGQGADPYIKIQPNVSLDGLSPALLQNFKAMVQEYGETTGKSVIVTSGFRSYKQQEELYRKDPTTAAKPGRSLHEFGLALDVNSKDLDAMDKLGLMRKYGFTRPVAGEPWHTEPAGIQVNLTKAKNDANFAEQVIHASLFKGGGGVATMAGMPKGERNQDVAISLLDLDAAPTAKSDKDVANELVNSSDKAVRDFNADRQQRQAANTENYNNVSYIPADTGYAGSVNSTSGMYDQSRKYSMNNNLPDIEVMPDSGGFDASLNQKPIANKEELKATIADLSRKAGVDPGMMTAFAAVESSLNPNAKASTSSASGLFQFTNATWREQLSKHGRKYNLNPNTSPTDITASTLLAAEYMKENIKRIKSIKPDINITDVYLTHFLGAGGARMFLSADPNTIAARILPKFARSNKAIFYDNGRALTVGQIYSNLSSKLGATASRFGIQLAKNQTSTVTNSQSGNVDSEVINGGPDAMAAGYNKPAVSYDMGGPGLAKTYNDSNPSYGIVPPVTRSVDSGSAMGVNSLSTGINTISDTLDKSLNVQTEIRELLRQFLQNVTPENLNAVKDNLMKVNDANTPNTTARPIPKPAVDLGRKSA